MKSSNCRRKTLLIHAYVCVFNICTPTWHESFSKYYARVSFSTVNREKEKVWENKSSISFEYIMTLNYHSFLFKRNVHKKKTIVDGIELLFTDRKEKQEYDRIRVKHNDKSIFDVIFYLKQLWRHIQILLVHLHVFSLNIRDNSSHQFASHIEAHLLL